MDVQIKKLHPDVVIPEFKTPGAAAIDLTVQIASPMVLKPQQPAVLIPTGLSVYIGDPDYVGIIVPRSSYGHKLGLVLGNGTGIIDSDYQGPLMISAWNRNPYIAPSFENGEADGSLAFNDGYEIIIEPGDRIAQMMFVPIAHPTFKVVEEFTDVTHRGEGGFGSTGK